MTEHLSPLRVDGGAVPVTLHQRVWLWTPKRLEAPPKLRRRAGKRPTTTPGQASRSMRTNTVPRAKTRPQAAPTCPRHSIIAGRNQSACPRYHSSIIQNGFSGGLGAPYWPWAALLRRRLACEHRPGIGDSYYAFLAHGPHSRTLWHRWSDPGGRRHPTKDGITPPLVSPPRMPAGAKSLVLTPPKLAVVPRSTRCWAPRPVSLAGAYLDLIPRSYASSLGNPLPLTAR